MLCMDKSVQLLATAAIDQLKSQMCVLLEYLHCFWVKNAAMKEVPTDEWF